MENLFNELGEKLNGFQPEVPGYMESRVMNAVNRSNRSFWSFSFTHLNVFIVVGMLAGAAAWMFFASAEGPQPVAQHASVNSNVASDFSAPVVTPIVSDNAGNISFEPAEITLEKSSRSEEKNRSHTSQDVKAQGVEIINCSGTPEISEVNEVYSNTIGEVVKTENSQTTEISNAPLPEFNNVEKKPKGKKFIISTFHN